MEKTLKNSNIRHVTKDNTAVIIMEALRKECVVNLYSLIKPLIIPSLEIKMFLHFLFIHCKGCCSYQGQSSLCFFHNFPFLMDDLVESSSMLAECWLRSTYKTTNGARFQELAEWESARVICL